MFWRLSIFHLIRWINNKINTFLILVKMSFVKVLSIVCIFISYTNLTQFMALNCHRTKIHCIVKVGLLYYTFGVDVALNGFHGNSG